MSDKDQVVVALDDPADMVYVRNKRKKIIEALLPDDKDVTTDPKMLSAIGSTLDSMERGSLTRLRIKQEEKKQAADGAIAELIGKVLLGMNNNVGKVGGGQPPVLPDGIKTRDYVPGEMDQGTHDVSPEEFMNK